MYVVVYINAIRDKESQISRIKWQLSKNKGPFSVVVNTITELMKSTEVPNPRRMIVLAC